MQTAIQTATLFGYQPFSPEEAAEQYPAEINFTPDNKAVPFNGAVYKDKRGNLQLFWMPQGRNYASEYDSLVGWYDVPDAADIEEFCLESTALTPAYDEVEPDHPDSWPSLLGLI